MRIADCEFEYVCDVEPSRDSDGLVRQFMPQDRYRNVRRLPLNKYGHGPFCKFQIPNRFQCSGVYVLAIDANVLYIGECVNLSRRFNAGYGNISPKNCFKGGQETNCRLNNLIYTSAQTGNHISLWLFKTTEYKSVESTLRRSLNAGWNRV